MIETALEDPQLATVETIAGLLEYCERADARLSTKRFKDHTKHRADYYVNQAKQLLGIEEEGDQ